MSLNKSINKNSKKKKHKNSWCPKGNPHLTHPQRTLVGSIQLRAFEKNQIFKAYWKARKVRDQADLREGYSKFYHKCWFFYPNLILYIHIHDDTILGHSAYKATCASA